MWKEFKEFAIKGNAFDMAIGLVVGGAFGKIVQSLVDDIIMPIIGAITGGIDFSNLFLGLNKAVTATSLVDARKQGAVLAYGTFLTYIVNFLIVAFALFLVVKQMNKLKTPEPAAPAAPPVPPREEVLLEQIRDLLAKK